MKNLGLLLIVGLIAMGCSKDQKVVKQLSEGEWKVTAITVDGVAQPDSTFSDYVYTFEKCKLKKEGTCDGKYTYEDPDKGTQTQNFNYAISDKGEKISITTEIDLFGVVESETITADIIENSSDKFIWSYTDEDGTTTETTIEKI